MESQKKENVPESLIAINKSEYYGIDDVMGEIFNK